MRIYIGCNLTCIVPGSSLVDPKRVAQSAALDNVSGKLGEMLLISSIIVDREF